MRVRPTPPGRARPRPGRGLVLLVALAASGCGWQPLNPLGAGFEAEVPGEAVVRSLHAPTRSGPVELRLAEVATPAGAAWTVAWADLEVDDRDRTPDARLLAALRDGALEKLGARALGERALSVSGYPALEYRTRVERGGLPLEGWFRSVVTDTRQYQLGVVAPEGLVAEADRAHFFDSFRVLPKAFDPWREYQTPEGRFRVELPGEPRRSTQRITPPGTPAATLISHEVRHHGLLVIASTMTLPNPGALTPAERLEGSLRGAVEGMHGTLVSSHDLELDGLPAREFEASTTEDGRPLRVRGRIVVSETHAWQLLLLLPEDLDRDGWILRVLDSFHVEP